MGKHYSIQEREGILESFSRSGLSSYAFSRRNKLCYTTLRKWLRARSNSMTLVEVKSPSVKPESQPSGSPVVVRLSNGVRVDLNGSWSIEAIAKLMDNLQQAER